MPLILFIVSLYLWENNQLLNTIYWDDLDIIDQDHIKSNVSQFCLYLGFPWTNFYQYFDHSDVLQPATKTVISTDLENVGQGLHLQKNIISRLLSADCNQTFTKMMHLELTTKAPHHI